MEKSVEWIAGVDYGSRMAGTTALCLGTVDGDISALHISEKNKDADAFLESILSKYQGCLVCIDAPLSLPAVYRGDIENPDYFFRKCDREMGAMSPMFLGGLTARAMQLKSKLQLSGHRVEEVWPRKMAESLGFPMESYKKSGFLKLAIEILSGKYAMEPRLISNWHQLDSVLAYAAGIKIKSGSAKTSGDPDEGLIYY